MSVGIARILAIFCLPKVQKSQIRDEFGELNR